MPAQTVQEGQTPTGDKFRTDGRILVIQLHTFRAVRREETLKFIRTAWQPCEGQPERGCSVLLR